MDFDSITDFATGQTRENPRIMDAFDLVPTNMEHEDERILDRIFYTNRSIDNTPSTASTPKWTKSAAFYWCKLSLGILFLLAGIAILIACTVYTVRSSKAASGGVPPPDPVPEKTCSPQEFALFTIRNAIDLFKQSENTYDPNLIKQYQENIQKKFTGVKLSEPQQKQYDAIKEAYRTLLEKCPETSDSETEDWYSVSNSLDVYYQACMRSVTLLGTDASALQSGDGALSKATQLGIMMIQMLNGVHQDYESGQLSHATLQQSYDAVRAKLLQEGNTVLGKIPYLTSWLDVWSSMKQMSWLVPADLAQSQRENARIDTNRLENAKGIYAELMSARTMVAHEFLDANPLEEKTANAMDYFLLIKGTFQSLLKSFERHQSKIEHLDLDSVASELQELVQILPMEEKQKETLINLITMFQNDVASTCKNKLHSLLDKVQRNKVLDKIKSFTSKVEEATANQ